MMKGVTMPLDFLRQSGCNFYGPALPEPYVQFELEKALRKHELLPDALRSQAIHDDWEVFRRKLRNVSPTSGPVAITNRILDPLLSRLGYQKLDAADTVLTREGDEDGGSLMTTEGGAVLRCWAIDYDADLEAPTQRGHAHRFSPVRIAYRVLLAKGERVGLITNGIELRLLLCDPARPDSHIEIDLNFWRDCRAMPDGYQLLLAMACPKGVAALPEIVEDARLKQNKVTKELRVQARKAVEEFVQAVLDHPDNAAVLAGHTDKAVLARQLWHEGLIIVYRLLFILKCESTSDSSRVFRFASTPLWRNSYSPSTALARNVRRVLDEGILSGRYLEDGLHVLFKLFAEGLDHPGLNVRPLGGALFGASSTPLLSSLRWGELAVAHLIDRLLWSDTKRGRERVHYGPLDVEDLGRVYEALLELEPGIATEPMCRLRRQKLEVVVPAAQGEKYRAPGDRTVQLSADDEDEDQTEDEAEEESEQPTRGKKTKVEWIEAIPAGRFYLRVGLGRKSSGSYYTPHSFVRFLVQETLGPQCDERSPRNDPNPGAILKLKVIDPACGSGHFLVEACRFLAAHVYEAARLCDELASKAELDAEAEKNAARQKALTDRAAELRRRLKDLPDQEDELLSYLPSRSAGAEKAILSAHDIARAEGICRRLAAVHCLYGVDLNPLAVELAKLSLWIESHAEGLPLTFLDHRIVVGNSLTGPFWDNLRFAPGSQQPVNNLFSQDLNGQLQARLADALSLVNELDVSVGVDINDVAHKVELKKELDDKLLPFRILAAAWSGGVMLGTDQPDDSPRCDDEAYAELLKHVGTTGKLPAHLDDTNLRAMIAKGLGITLDDPNLLDPRNIPVVARPALPFDLTFPEVFHPDGQPFGRHGFDAVIGNPPWDRMLPADKEFFASYRFDILNAPTKRERQTIQEELLATPEIADRYESYISGFRADEAVLDVLYQYQVVKVDGENTIGKQDAFRAFMERNTHLLGPSAVTGVVVPSAFHANEGATGVRRLYLERMALRCCFSFENRRKLFEIDSRFKFALVVAQKGKATEQFACGFYLHDDEWLFGDRKNKPPLKYTLELVRRTGGEYLSFLELRDEGSRTVVGQCFSGSMSFGKYLEAHRVSVGRELNTTDDAYRCEPVEVVCGQGVDPREPQVLQRLNSEGYLLLHEGRTFHQYTDRWEFIPKYVVPLANLLDKKEFVSNARFYRLTYRVIAASTNERTGIFSLHVPGVITQDKNPTERAPSQRANSLILGVLAAANSYAFDFCLRQFVSSATVNWFFLARSAFPELSGSQRMLSHAALRLICNHLGYEALWHEQLADVWREPAKTPFTWPVLPDNDARWVVRAIIDAVVADAYGLSREQYEHVLSTFSHASYKKAPQLCIAAFDELAKIGLEAFCKKHDPYWDIPLNENLPKPVIDLPIPEDDGEKAPAAGKGTRRRKKRAAVSQPGLFDKPVNEPDPDHIAAVTTLLQLNKALTCADVERHFNLDPAQAKAVLKCLVDKGLALEEGKASKAVYRWSGS
jgi:hypothetical protein